VLSKGHANAALGAVLAQAGFIERPAAATLTAPGKAAMLAASSVSDRLSGLSIG
jgi:transketolase N-terminal domain/subunit